MVLQFTDAPPFVRFSSCVTPTLEYTLLVHAALATHFVPSRTLETALWILQAVVSCWRVVTVRSLWGLPFWFLLLVSVTLRHRMTQRLSFV